MWFNELGLSDFGQAGGSDDPITHCNTSWCRDQSEDSFKTSCKIESAVIIVTIRNRSDVSWVYINVHLGSQMYKYMLCMRENTQTIKTPSPSESIQESSIFLTTSHFFSVFISSPLSPHPIHQLIRRLIPSPNHKSWMSIFLSFATIYACFLKLNTLGDAHFFMHGVYLLQHCACIESLMDYKCEVKTPDLICLYCFIFKEHTFSPHQLGNGKDAAGEKESRWGVGDQIKSTPSYMAHEAVSSSFDPPLTPHIRECCMWGEVCLCVQ